MFAERAVDASGQNGRSRRAGHRRLFIRDIGQHVTAHQPHRKHPHSASAVHARARAIQRDEAVVELYDRLVNRGKPRVKDNVSVMLKLLRASYGVFKADTRFKASKCSPAPINTENTWRPRAVLSAGQVPHRSRLLRFRRNEGRDDAAGDLLKCSVDELEPTAATLLDGAHDGPSIRQRIASA